MVVVVVEKGNFYCHIDAKYIRDDQIRRKTWFFSKNLPLERDSLLEHDQITIEEEKLI